MPKKITEEIKNRVVELFEGGMTRQDIQYEVDLSQPVIRRILSENGHPPMDKGNRTEITEEIKDRIVKLRNQGLSSGKIAERIGISKRTVLNIIAERVEGITASKRGESLSAFEFIKIWQQSKSVREVATIAGLTIQGVFGRASLYKQKGVPLKRLVSGSGDYNWDELAEFADLLLEDEDDV